MILKEIGQLKRDKNLPAPPWRAILTSRPVIALNITGVRLILILSPLHVECEYGIGLLTFLFFFYSICNTNLVSGVMGLLCRNDRSTKIYEKRFKNELTRKWNLFIATVRDVHNCFVIWKLFK